MLTVMWTLGTLRVSRFFLWLAIEAEGMQTLIEHCLTKHLHHSEYIPHRYKVYAYNLFGPEGEIGMAEGVVIIRTTQCVDAMQPLVIFTAGHKLKLLEDI